MTVAVLHRVFDESFARDSIPSLRSAGYTDAIRYAIGAGKAISLAEFNAFITAGMSVTLVDEGGAQMGLSGWSGGIARATATMQVLDSLGVPRSSIGAMYYATEDPSRRNPNTYSADVSFFSAVAVIHAQYGGRRIGIYGSGPLIDRVMAAVPQVTLGWSVRTWGVSPRSNLVQEPNPTMSTLGGTVDQNTALTVDWGQFPSPIVPVSVPTAIVPTSTIVSTTTDSKEGVMNTLRVEIPVSKGYGALHTSIPWPSVVSVDKEGSDPDADHFYLTGSVQRQQRDGMLYLTITGAGQGDPDHNNLLGTDAAPAIAAVYVTVSA